MGNSHGRGFPPAPSPVPPDEQEECSHSSNEANGCSNVGVSAVVEERLPEVHQKYYPAHCQQPYNLAEFFKSASLSNSLLTAAAQSQYPSVPLASKLGFPAATGASSSSSSNYPANQASKHGGIGLRSQGNTPSPATAMWGRKRPRLGDVTGWSSLPDVPSPREDLLDYPMHLGGFRSGLPSTRPPSSLYSIEPSFKERRSISFFDESFDETMPADADCGTDRTLCAEENPNFSPSRGLGKGGRGSPQQFVSHLPPIPPCSSATLPPSYGSLRFSSTCVGQSSGSNAPIHPANSSIANAHHCSWNSGNLTSSTSPQRKILCPLSPLSEDQPDEFGDIFDSKDEKAVDDELMTFRAIDDDVEDDFDDDDDGKNDDDDDYDDCETANSVKIRKPDSCAEIVEESETNAPDGQSVVEFERPAIPTPPVKLRPHRGRSPVVSQSIAIRTAIPPDSIVGGKAASFAGGEGTLVGTPNTSILRHSSISPCRGRLHHQPSLDDVPPPPPPICAVGTPSRFPPYSAYRSSRPTSSLSSSGSACLMPPPLRLPNAGGPKRGEDDDEVLSNKLELELISNGGCTNSSEPHAPHQHVGITFGPITSAVIGKGLRAKLRTISSWLVNGKEWPTIHPSASFSSVRLRRWHSAKSSWSLSSAAHRSSGGVSSSSAGGKRRPGSWRISSLTGTKKSKSSVSAFSDDEGSTASLNSLADGRTPWPIPWLDAIFLPDFPNRAKVSEKDFIILGTIATGAFGHVYRACLRSAKDVVFAMKVQKKSEVISQDAIHQVKQEVAIHYSLCNSPFVTRLHFAWQSRSSLYMVLHYVAGYGDLHQLWRDEGPFADDVVAVYTAELATALDYIHGYNVIFRDLKMENVVLDDNGHIQLVDFGLAKWLSMGDRTRTICGTLQYMAPEILRMEFYSHSVDWWSLGVLVHALLFGDYPFSAGRDHTSMHIPEYVPPEEASKPAGQLLTKLLNHDPHRRLRTLLDLRREQYFDGISFERIQAKQLHPFDLIPRMRRCDTCNRDLDIESMINGSSDPFRESYDDIFRNFQAIDADIG